jgi:hypothetical protein
MNEETGHQHAHCLCCDVSDAVGRLIRTMGPSENVRQHFRQSRIEFLKGIRTALDERIENLGRTPHKGMRVEVE